MGLKTEVKGNSFSRSISANKKLHRPKKSIKVVLFVLGFSSTSILKVLFKYKDHVLLFNPLQPPQPFSLETKSALQVGMFKVYLLIEKAYNSIWSECYIDLKLCYVAYHWSQTLTWRENFLNFLNYKTEISYHYLA